jgi:hypothetical protein
MVLVACWQREWGVVVVGIIIEVAFNFGVLGVAVQIPLHHTTTDVKLYTSLSQIGLYVGYVTTKGNASLLF